MSQEQLAQLLGKSKSTISRYESGEIDIPSSVLLKILETVNVPLEEIFSKSSNVKQVIYPYKEIPLYSVPVSAGPGAFPDKVRIISMISVPRIDATFAVQVKGDSMEPVVKDGTVLLVNGNNVTPRDGEMIVCTYDRYMSSGITKKMERSILSPKILNTFQFLSNLTNTSKSTASS